jgi:hypothetical protein
MSARTLQTTRSDVFLTRDGGFHWEEIRKDAHLWEYGDSGSIIILANDEEPVDHVLYTTDEGLTWHTYAFDEKIRVSSSRPFPRTPRDDSSSLARRRATRAASWCTSTSPG